MCSSAINSPPCLILPMLIDSHCHFDFAVFDENRTSIWQRCQAQGINQLIIPATEPSQWPRALEIQQQYSGIAISCGVHPCFIRQAMQYATLSELTAQIEQFIQQHRVVALGECGLDKSIGGDLSLQEALFEQHILLAKRYQLPLIIHVRQAHNEVIRLLKKHQANAGVIHAFSGSLALAEDYWRLGFYLGVGGTITYPRAKKHDKLSHKCP